MGCTRRPPRGSISASPCDRGFREAGFRLLRCRSSRCVQLARRQALKCLNYSTWAPAGFLSQSMTLSPAGGSRQTQRARVPCAPVFEAGARRADERPKTGQTWPLPGRQGERAGTVLGGGRSRRHGRGGLDCSCSLGSPAHAVRLCLVSLVTCSVSCLLAEFTKVETCLYPFLKIAACLRIIRIDLTGELQAETQDMAEDVRPLRCTGISHSSHHRQK